MTFNTCIGVAFKTQAGEQSTDEILLILHMFDATQKLLYNMLMIKVTDCCSYEQFVLVIRQVGGETGKLRTATVCSSGVVTGYSQVRME